MEGRSEGIQHLRKRKNMVPTRLAPSQRPTEDFLLSSPQSGSSHTSSNMPAKTDTNGPVTELEMDDLTSDLANGMLKHNQKISNHLDDGDEDETLFEQGDEQPLLGAGSGRPTRTADGEDEAAEGDGEIQEEKTETWFGIGLQVFFPYIIAGFGTVGAGMVLDVVQHWEVFQKVSEIFILVPSLLGLKGNLEMTLASRLSTQANLGNLDKRKEMWSMVGANLALTQAQAIVVGFLASFVAMVMGWIPEGKFDLQHGLLLSASSMLTAALASFVLGSVMVIVVVLSRKLKINPDNVATPIAASLGDLTTLSLLSGIAVMLYKAIGNQHWLAPTIVTSLILLTPLWLYISFKNKYTNDAVYAGWTPVLCAMVISSVGGLILDFTVGSYHGIAVFQPVINGVGGNLVAVHASRISTALHVVSKPGKLPARERRGCPNPGSTFCGKTGNGKAARVLLSLVIPGHLIFMYTISYMKAGHTSITLKFALIYLTAAMLQVIILLYLAHWIVNFIWKLGDDPDNVAIPYLTAIGDLLGTMFLAIAFHLLYLMGDKDADVGE